MGREMGCGEFEQLLALMLIENQGISKSFEQGRICSKIFLGLEKLSDDLKKQFLEKRKQQ